MLDIWRGAYKAAIFGYPVPLVTEFI